MLTMYTPGVEIAFTALTWSCMYILSIKVFLYLTLQQPRLKILSPKAVTYNTQSPDSEVRFTHEQTRPKAEVSRKARAGRGGEN